MYLERNGALNSGNKNMPANVRRHPKPCVLGWGIEDIPLKLTGILQSV
jgi:hypothetical protein